MQWAAEQVPVEAPDRLPPRRRLLGQRRSGRPLGRHDDGLQPARRRADGDARRSLDPAAILYLLRSGAASLDEIDEVLERESGLLGLSGPLGERRGARARGEPAARRALDLYCYRIAGAIGSLAVALGGLDAIAFTGGVGEGSAFVRSSRCAGGSASWASRSTASATARFRRARRDRRPRTQPVRVAVVHAREDVVAARAVRRCLG